jgi:hypothetical protein
VVDVLYLDKSHPLLRKKTMNLGRKKPKTKEPANPKRPKKK